MDKEALFEQFFRAVFDKAGRESFEVKKTPQAEHIADVIFGGEKKSARTFVRLYNKYVAKSNLKSADPKMDLLNSLAKYLGYADFLSYSQQFSEKASDGSVLPFSERQKEEKIIPKKSNEAEDLEKMAAIRKRIDEINQSEPPKIIAADHEKKKTKPKLDSDKNNGTDQSSANQNLDLENANEQSPKTPVQNVKNTHSKPAQKPPQKRPEKSRRKKRILGLLIFIVGLLFWSLYYFNRNNSEGGNLVQNQPKFCVAWQDDYYVKVNCETAQNYPERYQWFETLEHEKDFEQYADKRKISVKPNTIFFNELGDPLVWYSPKGDDYDFFNFSGKHPVTRRNLLPITEAFLQHYFGFSGGNVDWIDTSGIADSSGSKNETLTCDANQWGTLMVENNTNGTIRLSLRYAGKDDFEDELVVLSNSHRLKQLIPAGKINYMATIQERNQLVETRDIWLNSCDTHQLVFNGNYDLEEPKVVAPPCEQNLTGGFAFKNNGTGGIRIRVATVGSRSFNARDFTLASKELKTLKSIPAQEYTYSVYSNQTNELIERGRFTVQSCETGKYTVEENTNGMTNTGTSGGSRDCETKDVGDYCFTNNWKNTIHVRIGFQNPGSHLTRFFREIDIEPGATECFLDEPAGAYNLYYYPLEVSARTIDHHKNGKIRIEACGSGKKDLNFIK